MTTRIKFRRDTASNWTASNPILAEGEPGLETDTHKLKYGNGTSTWTVLAYSSGGVEIGGDGQINIGYETTTDGGPDSIAIGTQAGIGQAWSTVSLGNNAGNEYQGPSAIAIGRSAGESGQDWNAIAIGRYSGASNQGQETVAIGKNSGNYNQSQHAIAIGKDAGRSQQNIAAVAIGEEAGESSQSFRAIAVGRWAGNYQQGNQAVAVGALAGKVGQGGYAIAIGRHAGEVDQGQYAIAIGQEAGMARTPGNTDGYTSQTWSSGGATSSTTMILAGVSGVYPGMAMYGTGTANPSHVTDVNTGTNQITFTPAQSDNASGSYDFFGEQGDYAIAVGAYAGRSIQHPNSVIINASGNEVNSAGTGTVVIKTVRAITTSSGFFPCYYNPTTGELVYFTGP